MRHLHKSLSVLFVGALLLAGCAGAPETPSSAAPATPPPQPSRPQPAPAGTQQPAPAVNIEGMTIFEMQERLNELGYKLGTVDGVSGPRTVEALKKFQSDNKLTPTGTIDPETIRKLRSAK